MIIILVIIKISSSIDDDDYNASYNNTSNNNKIIIIIIIIINSSSSRGMMMMMMITPSNKQLFQMICSRRYCYPRWEPPDQQRWDLENDVKGRNHNWTLTHSIHVSIPKNVTSFFSPQLLRDGADMYADIGRNVLRKSGKLHLIEGEKGKEEGGD